MTTKMKIRPVYILVGLLVCVVGLVSLMLESYVPLFIFFAIYANKKAPVGIVIIDSSGKAKRYIDETRFKEENNHIYH